MRVTSLVLIACLFVSGATALSQVKKDQLDFGLNRGHSDVNDVHSAQVRETPADSMYFEVIGGETLIFALPDSLSGADVESWSLSIPPALSKLSDRSFMWTTRRQDAGMYSLKFEGTSTINVDNFAVDRVEGWTANVRIR